MAQVKFRRPVFLAALTIIALMLSGCRPVQAPTPTPPAEEQETQIASELPLVGTSWQVESFGRPEQDLTPIMGTRLTLNFGITRYAGDGGCNWFLGVYGADETSLRLRTPATTSARCDPPGVMQQEATYLSVLWNILAYRKDGERLLGYGVNDQLMLTFMPSQPVEFETTAWILRFQHNNRRMVPANPQAQITAQFDAGQVNGSAGCSTYTAAYTLDNDQFVLSDLVTTQETCTEPAGVAQQEELFLTNMQSATRLIQTGGLLQLLSADGETLLAFGTQ